MNLSKLLAFTLLTFAPCVSATQILISNQDGAGEGFNDSTAVSAVGGNTATTLGAQRLAVFERAADILESYLDSSVAIVVSSQFDPLDCNASAAVLGSAGSIGVYRDFSGATQSATWYPSALANDLAGSDLSGATAEINATFNSSIDNNDACLSGKNWYYGFDDPATSATPNDTSLLSVVIHEILHGLGVSSQVAQDGSLLLGYIDIYSTYLYDANEADSWGNLSQAQRATSATNTGNLLWNGTQVNSAAANIPLSDGLNGSRVEMYAPSPYEGGSSVSHFSVDATPNELMEPSYTEFLDVPGLATQLLADIGWTLSAANTAPTINAISNQTLNEDTDLDVALSATDPQNDSLTFSLVSATADLNASVSGTTLTLNPSLNYNGAGTVTVKVSDGEFEDSTSFNVTVSAVNDAPVMTAVSDQTLDEDSDKNVTLSATDVENDSLTFSIESAPASLNASVSGTTLTIDPVQDFNGAAAITVKVSDGSLEDSSSFNVTVSAVNDAPVFTSQADISLQNITTTDVVLSATDVDNDDNTLIYSIVSFDSNFLNVSINAATLTIDPVDSATGSSNVTVQVSDGNQAVQQTFAVNLTDQPNQAPVLATIGNQALLAGSSINLTLSASDPENDSLSYSVSGVTNGLLASVSGNNLTITAASDFSGVASLTVTVSDGQQSDSDTVGINVLPAFSLSSGDRQLADGDTLQAGLDSVELQLSGGDGQFTVEVIFNGSAQPGLLQSSNSGYQLLMPTSGAFAGTYTLNVTDGNGFTSSFDIERPLRVSTSAPTLLSLAQQQLWIEGAPAATMIDLASSSSEITFSNDQNQAISQLQVPDDAAQFNRASANLLFSQQPLPNTVTLTANAGVLIPQGEVTADIIRGRQLAMTVDDQNQQAVANASISVTDNRFSDWNLPTVTNSDNSGTANLVLPAEALSLSVSASGYVSQTVQLDATQTELSIILSSQQTPFTISGSVTAQGFDFASERPRVVLILDDERQVVLATTLNSSRNQASFEWQGDIAEVMPESIRITHTQASDITIPVTVNSDSAVINALLLAIPSATEDEPVTLSVGSSAGGGSALWLLLLTIGLTFFTRKAFTH